MNKYDEQDVREYIKDIRDRFEHITGLLARNDMEISLDIAHDINNSVAMFHRVFNIEAKNNNSIK